MTHDHLLLVIRWMNLSKKRVGLVKAVGGFGTVPSGSRIQVGGGRRERFGLPAPSRENLDPFHQGSSTFLCARYEVTPPVVGFLAKVVEVGLDPSRMDPPEMTP